MWSSILKLLINIDRHDLKGFAKTSENKPLLTGQLQKPTLEGEQVLPITLSGLLN